MQAGSPDPSFHKRPLHSAHLEQPRIPCADVSVVHKGTLPDERVIPVRKGTSMFRESFQKEVTFYRKG